MNGRLADFIAELFANAPQTRQANELREELAANLQDKYDDLIRTGIEPDEAYRSVIANVGDARELIDSLVDPQAQQREERKQAALLTALGIMIIILSPISFLLTNALGAHEAIAASVFFVFVAAGVGILVYNNIVNNPRYFRQSDDLVEEFKEFSTKRDRDRRVKNTLISCIVSLILPLYFILSFLTNAWHITWILFLLIPLSTALINAYYAFKE